MSDTPAGNSERVEALLARVEAGDESALQALFDEVYQELRRLARGALVGQPASLSLQPTELVHELYLRLARSAARQWAGRIHFFRVASLAMRQILVDHARRRNAARRKGQRVDLSMSDLPAEGADPTVDAQVLERALAGLEKMDPDMARIVELRIFTGLEMAEIAEVLGRSKRTVERRWRSARAWLSRELSET